MRLRAPELFEELGIKSANDLKANAFSYPQIVSLLARHKGKKGESGTLFYEGSNYFPILLPDGSVEFMSFCSRQPWGKHAGWRGCFMGSDPNFKKGSF